MSLPGSPGAHRIALTGQENIAPYSQWQNLTFDPPMVMFSANHYPDGRRKDTVINAERTGWFVWNMATYPLREEINKSAMAFEANESEWDHLDVTKVYADNYPIPWSRNPRSTSSAATCPRNGSWGTLTRATSTSYSRGSRRFTSMTIT